MMLAYGKKDRPDDICGSGTPDSKYTFVITPAENKVTEEKHKSGSETKQSRGEKRRVTSDDEGNKDLNNRPKKFRRSSKDLNKSDTKYNPRPADNSSFRALLFRGRFKRDH